MQLQVQNIKLDIISVGGLYTVVQLPSYKIAIDLVYVHVLLLTRVIYSLPILMRTHCGIVTVQVDVCWIASATYVIGQEDASN